MDEKITEKVYCYDHPSAYNKQDNTALLAALMNRESPAEAMALMNGNGMWNNPFVYLV